MYRVADLLSSWGTAWQIVDGLRSFLDAGHVFTALIEAVPDCEIHFLESVHVVSVYTIAAESQDWLVQEW